MTLLIILALLGCVMLSVYYFLHDFSPLYAWSCVVVSLFLVLILLATSDDGSPTVHEVCIDGTTYIQIYANHIGGFAAKIVNGAYVPCKP